MYYFAYGSNLSRRQMSKRCPESQPKCIAVLPNHELIFTGYSKKWDGGVASVKPSTGEIVIGAVYEISERDREQLDICEGHHLDYPRGYNRENVTVFTKDGDSVEVITYIKRKQSDERPPSQKYSKAIRQGYKDWGILKAIQQRYKDW